MLEEAGSTQPRAEAGCGTGWRVRVGNRVCSPGLRVSPQVPTGGNANSANNLIVMGGSNTTYLMMQSLSDIFNQAPGCDLAASSGTVQPLDYGCPGLNGEAGTTLSHPVVTNVTGSITNGSKTVSNVSPGTSGLLKFNEVSGTGIPAGDTIASMHERLQVQAQDGGDRHGLERRAERRDDASGR